MRPDESEHVGRSEEAARIDLAHVHAEASGEFRLHELGDHLDSVGALAAASALRFRAGDWARLAGRWHDLGKFQPAFQAYIRRGSGYDSDAHLEDDSPDRVDHSTFGAIHAVEHLSAQGPRGAAAGRLLAYIIAGHHTGLPDWYSDTGGSASLEARLDSRRSDYDANRGLPSTWTNGSVPGDGPPSRPTTSLWVRMLFSALVDADFLDTEAFMSPRRAEGRSGWKTLKEVVHHFDEFVDAKVNEATEVNRARGDVLSWCRSAASWEPGLFSLTVPTGGGKTLSSMAWALKHALAHGTRRIVYVIPYTSIIEQTVDVFREALGEAEPWTVLLEHHSSLDADRETYRTRLAIENWDAPVVVTTSVQFFESLFAARTSRVRKLHNLADSVIVLDEVQMLPPDFLSPILDGLQALSDHFGASVLLMTATQPAFKQGLLGLKGVREIVPDVQHLHGRLRRVQVDTPADLNHRVGLEAVSESVLEHPSVLCIVNRRQDARVLYEHIRKRDPHAVHLSALMCGAHRSAVIASIKQVLAAGGGMRVVSTQLVEAGVDLDFPVVFRAMAGLDSIAQAAGRCNREGRADFGRVQVFVPTTSPPLGILRKAEGVARSMIAGGLDDPLAPGVFVEFFRRLYWLQGQDLDKHRIRNLLDHDGRRTDLTYAFRTAARLFQVIPNEDSVSVVVRWAGNTRAAQTDAAIEALFRGDADRHTYRVLQRHTVSVRKKSIGTLTRTGAVKAVHDSLFVQTDPTIYDDHLGLLIHLNHVREPGEPPA